MNQADQNVVPGPTAAARYEGVPEGAVSLSPEEAEEARKLVAKVRDAYFRRLPESDPEYDEMQELLKKAQDLAANATIVEQGATMGIPGSGNSRELSGIPGSDFSLPGSETWENRQNPPVTVDAADASRVLYYGQDLAKQMPQAHVLRS